MSGLRVFAFGPFEEPRYAATVDRWVSPRVKANGWCCDLGAGHKTPRAAALHAAYLALDEWKRDSGGGQG